MKRPRPGARSLLALLLVTATGGLFWPGSPAAQKPIRIAGSLSLTGTYAELGQAMQRGNLLCVKHANEKGGVLGRTIELVIEDDESKAPNAVSIYEKLIAQDKVDAIISPYSSPLTDAVADVSEKHRLPMVASGAASPSIWKKGRKYVFMLLTPTPGYVEGVLDIATRRGLKTVAFIHEDTLFPKSVVEAGHEVAKRRGLSIVGTEAYPRGSKEIAANLARIRAADPDVLIAATYFDDAVAVTRQMKEHNINPRMFLATIGSDFPKFYEALARNAEFVYGAAQWEADFVTLRAGGLIPIARQYPGAREFVESHRKEFPGVDLSYQTAQGYGGCQVLLEAIRRAGSTEGPRVRDALSKLDTNTTFGPFRVDDTGAQTAHKMVVFQWQDGKKIIVWPDELAPGKPRFPTPPWNQRP